MISRITLTTAAIGIAALMSSAASASCGNSLYCNSSVSAYESAPSSSYSTIGNYGSSSYGSSYGSSYSTSGFGGVASDSYADSVYGSGSISGAYEDTSSYTSSSVSSFGLPGLGMNERLVPTSCDVNVHGASDGAKVLGCYKRCPARTAGLHASARSGSEFCTRCTSYRLCADPGSGSRCDPGRMW